MTPEETQDFIAHVTRHFQEVDSLTHVVLRGHLLLEEHLNNILRSSLFNPPVFDRMRLSFHHKLLLAQAFTVSQRGEGMWELLASINTLRNSIAHSLDAEHRRLKFNAMRTLYLRELEDPALRGQGESLPEHLLFLNAYALCNGYLRRAAEDAEFIGVSVRGMIGHMRREFYRPDSE